MRSFLKLTVMLLSVVLLLCTLVACGGDDITESPVITDAPETEAPETDAPETEASETEAPETEAPETEAPETEAPETEAPETDAPETDAPETEAPDVPVIVENPHFVDGVFNTVKFDFETDLAVADYIASIGEFATHSTLNKGIIIDGKWVYNDGCFAINDPYGIYQSDKFSVEFDFCFEQYITTENAASVFTILGDDDGALNDRSNFYMALRMSPDGTIYHDHAKTQNVQVELGKVYNYKIEIDRAEGKAYVYIDGELLCAPNFTPSALPLHFFRFMDNNKGAEMWFDNIVITAHSAPKAPVTDDKEPSVPAEEIVFNFDTDLNADDYIASFEGFSTNKAFKGTKISDGKWIYEKTGLVISDEAGIYDLPKYSIEFDFCFDQYITTENAASVFTIVTDDDGTLNGQSKFYMALRMSPDGTVYHDHAKDQKVKIELGKTYHYMIEVDKVAGTASVYIDGVLLSSPSFASKDLPYRCFRFMDNNKGASMWMDNIVIKSLLG